MLALVSPAKKLDFEPAPLTDVHSQPELLADAERLAAKARRLGRSEIAGLMKLSDKLADLNYHRFQAFEPPFDLSNARQAVHAFKGDTYVGLDAATLDDADLNYAQDHLRILSGLYGILRPLDLIQPYRLEMGTKFGADGAEDLYDFWDTRITDRINDATAEHADRTVVNLASQEYFKSVKVDRLESAVVTPVFKEIKDGEARVLSLFAKRARGMMARFIVTGRVDRPDGLKDFTAGGYEYRPDLSTADQPVFTRQQP